jgi:hypothetical protein
LVCALRRHRTPERADDGIRTRDPHLGKVMRYQLRYIRIASLDAEVNSSGWCEVVCGGSVSPVGVSCVWRKPKRSSTSKGLVDQVVWLTPMVSSHQESSHYPHWATLGCGMLFKVRVYPEGRYLAG